MAKYYFTVMSYTDYDNMMCGSTCWFPSNTGSVEAETKEEAIMLIEKITLV